MTEELTTVVLRGMTWDHPRGVDGLRAADPLLIDRHGITIEWEARSLLAFGDQHVADFASDFDIMVIDHPHVPDAVEAGALLPLDGIDGLDDLARESVGQSHDSYRYRGSQWALGVDAAAQVSAFRPDRADGAPVFWRDALELAAAGAVLWPYKPVDAFSTFATLLAQRGAPLARNGLFLERSVAGKVLEFMIRLADAVPAWCADANPIDVAEALVADNAYSVGVALFGYTNYSRAGFRAHPLAYDDIPSFDGRAGRRSAVPASPCRHPLGIRSWRSRLRRYWPAPRRRSAPTPRAEASPAICAPGGATGPTRRLTGSSAIPFARSNGPGSARVCSAGPTCNSPSRTSFVMRSWRGGSTRPRSTGSSACLLPT